jgi:hypothetical protein
MLDGDFPPLAFGKRRITTLAITLALQKQAVLRQSLVIAAANFISDALRQARLIGLAQSSHEDFLFGAIDCDGFERRFLAHDIHDRTGQTMGTVRFGFSRWLASAAHKVVIVRLTQELARGDDKVSG